jgi:hypothetical protein
LSQRRLAERKERKERQEQQATALPAEVRALLAAYEDPHLVQNVVDRLPPGSARVSLKLWGMLHRVYPMTDVTRRALDDEMAQAESGERTGPAADSAEQVPAAQGRRGQAAEPEPAAQERDPGWDF